MTKTFEAYLSSHHQLAVNAATPPLPPSSSLNNDGGNAIPKAPDKSKRALGGGGGLAGAAGSGVDGSCCSTSGVGLGIGSSELLLSAKPATSLAEEKSVTNLDDEGLRALLDEAINYKTPKDREGKSKLFNSLLSDAEDEIRKKHAYNASGPARHYSTTAKKRHRHRRQPSSISENLTHGGSLNDLAKQELYESTKMQRPKTVSTRQREGGSLPCNVNAGSSTVVDKQYFMDERAKQQEQRNRSKDYATCMGMDSESQSLLEGDSLSQEHHHYGGDVDEMKLPRVPNSYTSKATLQVSSAKVDDAVMFPQMQCDTGNTNVRDSMLRHQLPSTQHHSLVNLQQHKKLDVNGNLARDGGGAGSAPQPLTSAVSAIDAKKRKKEKKKSSENVINADQIEGHRADIINDIDELVNFIDGTDDKTKTTTKKQLHKQHSHSLNNEEKSKSSKRTRKKSNSMLQKSTSMEDVSTTNMDIDFDCRFDAIDVKEKTPLRPTKSNVERPSRHGKAWGISSEQIMSTSAENLEIADFIYVTKKKKSKKRRNSLGSRGHKQPNCETRPAEFHSLRVSSPRRRCAPHSDKSNESESDNESMHSLPMDADDDQNKSQQISYADIAKSSERPKWNRPPSERRKSENRTVGGTPTTTPATTATMTNNVKAEDASTIATITTSAMTAVQPNLNVNANAYVPNKQLPIASVIAGSDAKDAPTTKTADLMSDLSSLQNWPEIRNNKVNSAKTNSLIDTTNAQPHVPQQQVVQDWPTIINNGGPARGAQPPVVVQMQQPSATNQQQHVSKPQQQNQQLPPQPVQQQQQASMVNKQWQSQHVVAANTNVPPTAASSSSSSSVSVQSDNDNNGKNQVKCAPHKTNHKSTPPPPPPSSGNPNNNNHSNNNNNVKSAKGQQPQGYHIKTQQQVESQKTQSDKQQPVVAEQPIAVVLSNQEDDVVLNNTQQVLQQVSEQQPFLYPYKMPPNIRDVQSIEKMQMRSLQAAQSPLAAGESSAAVADVAAIDTATGAGATGGGHTSITTTTSTSSRHNSHSTHSHNDNAKHRPAVVILSSGADRHCTDLTFGFGINEQLLSGDVCADFVNRFYLPDVPTPATMQVDKLVNYIGAEWQDVLVQTHTGKVKYYTDDLS